VSSQFALLKTRRFFPFFLTQFLGAFNDNCFKAGLTILLTFQAAAWTTMSAGLIANLAAGLFMLLFFLFSATAGQLADKYDKARIARFVKVLEIGIIALGGVGFALHSLTWLMAAVFFLGLHSTIFGPVKYAILPQALKPAELLGGNALIEAGTFASILLGTILGGTLAAMTGGTVWITVVSMAVAVLGYLSSRQIPSCTAPAPELKVNWNPVTETWRNVRLAYQNKMVFVAIAAISWFWMYGALFLAQFPAYARNVLGGSESVVTLLLATFTIGIAAGSLACEKLSAHKVEIGLVPVGAIGLAIFGADFALGAPSPVPGALHNAWDILAHLTTWRTLADLLGLGFFGGIFCVPLYALMQQASEEHLRARMIACNNIINALYMVVGALGAAALLEGGMPLPTLFLLAAGLHVVVCSALFVLEPEFYRGAIRWLRRT
jgi:MFS family permease